MVTYPAYINEVVSIIKMKFSHVTFTVSDIEVNICEQYNISKKSIPLYVRHMLESGDIQKIDERYYFLKDEDWGGRLH